MANDEHVALLKKGVDAWNAWRDENPDIRPDLMGADLRRANLSGRVSQAEFTLFDLIPHEPKTRGVNLTGPIAAALNLSEADLRQANLSWASLVQANLIGANLPFTPLGNCLVVQPIPRR
jgi:uncharacterized protein YjbI with pentapeptide repeats